VSVPVAWEKRLQSRLANDKSAESEGVCSSCRRNWLQREQTPPSKSKYYFSYMSVPVAWGKRLQKLRSRSFVQVFRLSGPLAGEIGCNASRHSRNRLKGGCLFLLQAISAARRADTPLPTTRADTLDPKVPNLAKKSKNLEKKAVSAVNITQRNHWAF
jgi:hypothetical protein